MYFLIKAHEKATSTLQFSVYIQPFLNPLPDNKILDGSKLKQSADNNFKFHENSRKFSKWVENTVGKGEIACYEQFLLFPQCFQKACFPGASKGVIVREWVNSRLGEGQILFHYFLVLFFCSELLFPLNFFQSLTHYQTTNSRLFQTERVCRRQFQI